MEHPETFGQCLVRLREHRKLQQKCLALAASMDQSYLAGLESGRRPPPRAPQVRRLISALSATETESKDIFTAKLVTKLNTLISKCGLKEPIHVAHLLATVAGMNGQEISKLIQIARVLRTGSHL